VWNERGTSILFGTTNLERLRIDYAGNVGVGVTPETWFSNQKALQIGTTGAALSSDVGAAYYSNNAYRDSGGDWKRVGSGYATRNWQYNGAHYHDVAASGTADAAISWTTGLEVRNDGKARVPNGLLFGTDTAAANTLDDYEEGTFTPSGTGVNTSSSVGIYTKIGRVCHVQIWIEANGNTAGHLGGLPFVSGIGGVNYLGVGSVGFQNGTVNSIMTTGNTGGFYMYTSSNTTGVLTNGQQMHCSLTYITT